MTTLGQYASPEVFSEQASADAADPGRRYAASGESSGEDDGSGPRHESDAPTPRDSSHFLVSGGGGPAACAAHPRGCLFNLGERFAFVKGAESFLLDAPSRANKTVKVNVAWDESDYQIDVGTAEGVAEYKRIVDRNAQLGATHIVYEPRNTRHASRFNTTDGWGWEGSLFFSMGEQLREDHWSPVDGEVLLCAVTCLLVCSVRW
jgi:hypothetical protein